jgi:hypothetical protein
MTIYKIWRAWANIKALSGATKIERKLIRLQVMKQFYDRKKSRDQRKSHTLLDAAITLQNHHFPDHLRQAKKVLVVIIPENETINGGILSLFSIANQMYRLRHVHKYATVVMTRPNAANKTYYRNHNFRNSENVFRFEQISELEAVESLYIHIPEYLTDTFYQELPPRIMDFIKKQNNIHINILNQNINAMPPKENFQYLRSISNQLTQSVGHHAYYTQEVADRYDLPTTLLAAYTDLSNYEKSDFSKKEKIIIYSPDNPSFKQEFLKKLQRKLPEFIFIEIKGVTFENYMELATRCMFSITFGEGFDGYLAQPILQGGIGFAIYNDDFFPSENFKAFPNIFASENDMSEKITDIIKHLSSNGQKYKDLNSQLTYEYSKLYSAEQYTKDITTLALKKFALQPRKSNMN